MLLGCPVFPADNPWNRDVSADPVDPRSDAYIASMSGGTRFLHPDFGSNPDYGIPWSSVPGTQPRVPMAFDYADESDPGPYPFPPDAPIEAGGDRHVLVLDRDACKLYETFDSHYQGSGWRCGSGAVFDLRSNALRPDTWTSADAAGLPILPGLVRRDEVNGMFVADNGSDWFISGESNRAWEDDDLEQLKTVPGSAFEVVSLGTILH
jgi:hypothetical protein